MDILPGFMSVYHLHAWYLQRLERAWGFPGTGRTGRCKLLYGYWESSGRAAVFSTAESSLQPLKVMFDDKAKSLKYVNKVPISFIYSVIK